ncbi:hypothetical protein BH10PSE7_BH10PSE7_33350 [soil metagenome]
MRRALSFAAALLMCFSMTVDAKPILERVSFDSIEGWATQDHALALAAFRRSCTEIANEGNAFARAVSFGGTRQDWLPVCNALNSRTEARRFFERYFMPLAVHDPVRPEGLFTGYFEPEARGSRTQASDYDVPVYAKPPDLTAFNEKTEKRLGVRYGRLVDGKPERYFTRREIEDGALAGQGLELIWLSDWADAFFMQVQGSGRVRLDDGTLMRFSYAAKSGQPYTGIGGLLVDRGVLTRDDMSMQAIRAWMEKDPQAARDLMWENKSFVFFREVPIEDPSLGPPGAQKVSLTPLASLAVDRRFWMFGTPVWLDTMAPSGKDRALEPFRRLMIAQDTGTAIKGHARGDVFWGAGEAAAITAGHMKSPGSMTVLLPRSLAARLLEKQ